MLRDEVREEAVSGVHDSLPWEVLCSRPEVRSLPRGPPLSPLLILSSPPWAGGIRHCDISICHASGPPDPRGHVARGLRRHQVLPVP